MPGVSNRWYHRDTIKEKEDKEKQVGGKAVDNYHTHKEQ